jgi:nitrate/nitrite transporter NarK
VVHERSSVANRVARIVSLLLTQSTQSFALGALALLLPLIRQDIGMSFTQAGALSVVSTVSYATMQLPSGYLADRFPTRTVVIVGLLGLNILTLLIAVAPSYAVLAVLLFAIGIFRALSFSSGITETTIAFGENRRATAMNVFMAVPFVSHIALGIVGPPLAPVLGWRGLFVLFGAVSLIPIAVYWFVTRDSAVVHRPATHPDRAEVRRLLRQPTVWLSSFINFNRLAVLSSLRFWLPTYLLTDKSLSLSTAGLLVAAASTVSIAASLVGGRIADRGGRHFSVITISICVITIALTVLTLANNLLVIMMSVMLVFVFVQFYSGSLFEVPLGLLGRRSEGTVIGFGNFWANAGGLTMTFALGAIKDATGSFLLGFLALTVMCVLALALTGGMYVAVRRAGRPSMHVGA